MYSVLMESPGDRPLLRIGELGLLAATVPETLEPLRPQPGSLARRAPLALAGAGATAQIATAVWAQLLAGDPVIEAGQAGWPR